MEFTYSEYENMLDTLLAAGYEFSGFDELKDGDKVAILRHDVDWSPRTALQIAELEHDMGVSSNYFFLLTSKFYNALNEDVRDKIEEIRGLGHSIGVHFSTHQYWDSEPSFEVLSDVVMQERQILDTVVGEVEGTVAFHNPPDWVLNRSFEPFTSTYERRFLDGMGYFSDSNQRWREGYFLEDDIPPKIQILTHPVLWGEEDASVTERLQEERDHVVTSIEEFLEQENELWS